MPDFEEDDLPLELPFGFVWPSAVTAESTEDTNEVSAVFRFPPLPCPAATASPSACPVRSVPEKSSAWKAWPTLAA